MTQLTDEHFELHTKNKAEQYERQKIKFLEDRISVLEKSVSALNKVVGEIQSIEYERDNSWVILFGVLDQAVTNLTPKIE